MVHVKSFRADTHEKIAGAVEKFLRDNRLSPNACTIQYSTANIATLLVIFGIDYTRHYAMIVYEMEDSRA